jgi:HK97 family phage prohead protease
MSKEMEKRTYNVEFRAKGEDEGIVSGYAAVFRSTSNELWGFEEVIQPGAFDKADMSDVRALFNHDPNKILARSASGTLKLEIDETGLRYEFSLPNTTDGNDLREMMKRGDVSQSSFAFTVARDSWEERADEAGNPMLPLRHIHEVRRVYDVSPVTYPAYEAATATIRSLDELRAKPQPEEDAAIEIETFILTN